MFPDIEELFKKIRFNFVVTQDFENISLFFQKRLGDKAIKIK